MKETFKKIAALMMIVVIALSATVTYTADIISDDEGVMVLFTHDMHSHFLPSASDEGSLVGGYARLMTAIDKQKQRFPDALLVDGGDFSMGSLFQTGFTTSALELKLMGKMGYDVTTLGNHEFDYMPEGLASMLCAAVASGDEVPQIVVSNYMTPSESNTSGIEKAFEEYGVKPYTVIEKGDTCFVVFGIFGYESHDYAPNSGMVLEDPVEKAQQTVNEATAYCRETLGKEPVVICLSHSGTEDGEGEDVELAEAVDGIHVIVSAHTHETIKVPLKVNDTLIVSAGEYARNLGAIRFKLGNDGVPELISYELIPINGSLYENGEIAEYIELCKEEINQGYLADYGYTYDQSLVYNPYTFDSVDEVYETQHESTLGNLFADAYKWAAEKETGEAVDVAVTASGVIRETLPVGYVTVSGVFDAASLGVGTEGELISVYVTGKDLKNVLEVDASVQPLMDSAQLFASGVEYSFNQNRMIFNKVDYARLRKSDGTLEKIDNDKLYHIVTGMYMGQMLGSVEEKSFGLLQVVPRDKDGNPIEKEELVNYVIYDSSGKPLKEWYAIASYIEQMGGEIDAQYKTTDGRKNVYKSIAPWDLLRNANVFTFAAAVVIAWVLLLMVWLGLVIYERVCKLIQKRRDKETEHFESGEENVTEETTPSKSKQSNKKKVKK